MISPSALNTGYPSSNPVVIAYLLALVSTHAVRFDGRGMRTASSGFVREVEQERGLCLEFSVRHLNTEVGTCWRCYRY